MCPKLNYLDHSRFEDTPIWQIKKKEPEKKRDFSKKKYLKIFENFYDEKISEVIGRRIKLKRSEGPEDPEEPEEKQNKKHP